jgi:alkylhydroperoxidase family enzyme
MSFEPRVPVPPRATKDGVHDLSAVLQHYVPETLNARNAFNAALESSTTDPQARELVRLHNAEAVDCNYCRNVRYGDGTGEAILDEGAAGALKNFESSDLPAAHKAALRLASAFALEPGVAPMQVLPELREHYSDSEIADLVLQLVRCRAGSKLLVSLGLEPRSMPLTVV